MSLRFKRQTFYYGKLRRRSRLLKAGMLGGTLLILVVAFASVLLWQRRGENSSPDTSGRTTTTNYQPYKTFTTDYFSFQTDKNWEAVPAESTPTSFVYRAYKNKLVERDLTVYINQLPPRLMLTYVLPVEVSGNRLLTDDVSEHCRTSVPADFLAKSRNPTETVINGVHFTCQTDGTSVTIGTGVKGASYQADMSHRGSSAQYFILYRDVSYTARPQLFKTIVDSFKSQ